MAASDDEVNAQAPLAGVMVLDLSTRLPGPLATLLLAQAGARVIKVERPPGEEMRELEPRLDGMSAHFGWLNRGKTCIALDLRGEGRAQFEAMVERADVLIEQFRPGVMARLGLDYPTLALRNPRLVYCSITGYGQHDPRSLRAAHDLNYQAAAGLAAAAPTVGRGVPALPTALLGDIAGGSYPAFASITLALLQRAVTGKGQHLDIAMSQNLEIFSFWNAIGGALTGHWAMPGAGRHTGGSPRYNLYRTRDGRLLAVGALEDRFWAAFLEGIGLALPPGMEADDPQRAITLVAEHLATCTAAEWLQRLDGRDACCNLADDLADVVARVGSRSGLPDIRLPLAPQFTRRDAELPAAAPVAPFDDDAR